MLCYWAIVDTPTIRETKHGDRYKVQSPLDRLFQSFGSLMASSPWIFGIFYLGLILQQSLFLISLASTNVRDLFVFEQFVFMGFLKICKLIKKERKEIAFWVCVLAGSYCVSGGKTTWWAGDGFWLSPWDALTYTWKVQVHSMILTNIDAHSVLDLFSCKITSISLHIYHQVCIIKLNAGYTF